MAGKTLEEYFVSLGIKGQNVVLKNIKDVKKQAESLSKLKPAVNLGKNPGKGIAGVIAGAAGSVVTTSEREKEKQQKKEEKNTRQFSEGSKKFGNAVVGFAQGAENFDPAGVAKNIISAAGDAFSNITIFGFGVGNLPKGVAELANTMISMASSAIDLAKSSAATQYALSNRNATTRHYGGGGIGQGGMSRAQHSELVMTIAGSFGRIQKPLQETVNELVKSKNTEALARVASGNWASTGEDRGWFLQQIANETQGLPPSIAQAIQNSLLKSNADLIQDKGAEAGPQGKNAGWVNLQEDQNEKIFEATIAKNKDGTNQYNKLLSLSKNMNSFQIQMIETGVGFAAAISDATEAIKKLPEKIEKINKAFDAAAEKVYKYSLGEIDFRGMHK